MNSKTFVLLSLVFPMISHADQKNYDVPVSVIYNPVITITPDRHSENFPDRLPVKLIVNEKGSVDQVLYSEKTPDKYKEIIDNNMKLAKFTPYLKRGVPVKSIVPFSVRFFIQSEYDYNGELGE